MSTNDEIMSQLKTIEEVLKKERKGTSSWLIPALIAGIVSLAVSLTSLLWPSAQAKLEHTRKIAEVQGAIVKEFTILSVPTGDMLLKHSLKPLYDENSPSFADFENDAKGLRTRRVEEPGESSNKAADAKDFNTLLPQTPQVPTAAPPTSDEVVSKFNSPDRLNFSDQLVSRFGNNPAALVPILIAATLPDNDPRSYRVNLYIALTLGRLPNRWPQSADPRNVIEGLINSKNNSDPTFKKRLNEAIANRI